MRTVQFLPAALRDFDALDRLVQARVTAALERLASTGHGDVKKLNYRAGLMTSGCVSESGACSSTATRRAQSS
jgi:hypothetical protein